MNRLLEDLQIIEMSAFVAAPLGGMTMAQMGADVIRIDPIGVGIDFRRWPVTKEGASRAARNWHLPDARPAPRFRDLTTVAAAPGAAFGRTQRRRAFRNSRPVFDRDRGACMMTGLSPAQMGVRPAD